MMEIAAAGVGRSPATSGSAPARCCRTSRRATSTRPRDGDSGADRRQPGLGVPPAGRGDGRAGAGRRPAVRDARVRAGSTMAELDDLIASWTATPDRRRPAGPAARAAACRPAGSTGPRTCSPTRTSRRARRSSGSPHPELRRAADAERHARGCPATPGSVRSAGPALGEHNHEVWHGLLGLSDAEITGTDRRGRASDRRPSHRPGERMTYRLGVDVGGTFTDVLLVDADSGDTWRAKTASTPAGPVGRRAARHRQGLRRWPASRTARSPRCCTAPRSATNAILEGKGATVGLVTTQGFRQVLQIARSFVPGGLAGWIIWPKPEPLAALENTVEVGRADRQRRRGDHARSTRTTSAPQLRAAAATRHRGAGRLADQLLRQRRRTSGGSPQIAARGAARRADLAVQRGAARRCASTSAR